MAKKNEEERISDLALKIKQLEAQKKLLEARTKDKERKERTRRLIQIGAIIESMGISSLEMAERLKKYFEIDSKANDFFQDIISKIKK